MQKTSTWTMNEGQQKFVQMLGNYPNGITLLELKLDTGVEIKTGTINTLVSKGIVSANEEKEFACDVVYNGAKVGSTKLKRKVYRLVETNA